MYGFIDPKINSLIQKSYARCLFFGARSIWIVFFSWLKDVSTLVSFKLFSWDFSISLRSTGYIKRRAYYIKTYVHTVQYTKI